MSDGQMALPITNIDMPWAQPVWILAFPIALRRPIDSRLEGGHSEAVVRSPPGRESNVIATHSNSKVRYGGSA